MARQMIPRRNPSVSLVSLIALGLVVACSASGSGEPTGDGDGDVVGDGDQVDTGDGDGDGDGDVMGDGGTPGDGGAGATGGTGASPGSGGQVGDGDGDTPLPSFVLSEAGTIYTYTADGASMKIDSSDGGRVISFSIAGVETLVQKSSGAEQYGSVFWPSPQTWAWGPETSIPEINNLAYTPSVNGDDLILVSANNALLGLTVTKTHTPTTTGSGFPAISITYTMENTGTQPLGIAPWEVSRVATGAAFYPTGPTGRLAKSNLTIQEFGAYTWYNYDASGLNGVPKSFGDGSGGWLAWHTAGVVAIKSFPDVLETDFAPEEAEIELYANPNGTYMEVEQQGAYVTIAPGGSSTWTVIWTGAGVAIGSDASVGSTDLVDLVTTTL